MGVITLSYQQTIYNRLRQHGISEAGALGLLGNFESESNCEPFRIQGDFSPYRSSSKAFVSACMNGTKTKAAFCNGVVGFGIAQWTSPDRQAGLWDFWKASGKALDDAGMQADFVWKELQAYAGLLPFLKTTTDVFTACSRVCREYERPAVNNIDARFSAAKRIQREIDLDSWHDGNAQESGKAARPDPAPQPAASRSLTLRVTDEHCAGWPEASLVQALLICWGYDLHVVDGSWDDEDIQALQQFQRDHGLSPDGIAGPITWAKLLGRG